MKRRQTDTETRRHGEKESGLRVSSSSRLRIVSLTTDFGSSDYFVGAVKGAILSVCPEAHIIDITHEIPPQDIHAGAFTLLASYKAFPKKTIHVAVVDPGVGSDRWPILIESRNYFFVGPDNGLLSYAVEKESNIKVFRLTNERYFRSPLSATFHGRDIFAPIAGALASGVKPKRLGEEVDDYVRLGSLEPFAENDCLHAFVINIDRFGNIVTNILPKHLSAAQIERGFILKINEREITKLQNFYSEAEAVGEIFAIWGSAGFLEIVAYKSSAAESLNVKSGDTVALVVRDKRLETK